MRREEPFDPTGWFIPGKVPANDEERRRKRIAINLSLLWLLFPLIGLLQSGAPPAQIALVVAGMLAFIAIYNAMPYDRAPLARPRLVYTQLAVMTALAIVMTLADREGWAMLFLFAGISGAMRLPRRAAIGWIVACTALTVTTSLIDHADAATIVTVTATTLAIGFMMFAFR